MDHGKGDHSLHSLPNWRFAVMITISIICWSLAFIFIKIALNDLSFLNLTIMRFVVVGMVLGLISVTQSKKFHPLHKKDIIPVFILGFFGVIVYHLGLNYGEQYVSPGAASLIISTIPIFTVILAIMFLNEKITLRKFMGIVIALSGIMIISMWGDPRGSIEIAYSLGAIAVLVAALMGAFYTIAGKKLLRKYDPFSLTVYAMLLGSLGLLPFVNISLLNEILSLPLFTWSAIIFLGIFSTIVAYSLWYAVLKVKNASEVSVYLYAIPVISTIISYFVFDDPITPFFIVGGILIIGGVAIVNLKKKNK
jgi:drug/metabolite transporter (DMT)-like permease